MAVNKQSIIVHEIDDQLIQSLNVDERGRFERIGRVTDALVESMQHDRCAVRRALEGEENPAQLLRDYYARIDAAVERLRSLREQLAPLLVKLGQRTEDGTTFHPLPVRNGSETIWNDESIANFAAALHLDYKRIDE